MPKAKKYKPEVLIVLEKELTITALDIEQTLRKQLGLFSYRPNSSAEVKKLLSQKSPGLIIADAVFLLSVPFHNYPQIPVIFMTDSQKGAEKLSKNNL